MFRSDMNRDRLMGTSTCRVCGNEFFDEPLLRYHNMPKSAQFLPDAESLGSDYGVELDVCQCSGCGLVQLSNPPVHYYKEVIRSSAVSQAMTDFRKKQFRDFVKKYSLRRKKIIEIGCGRGEYLSIIGEFADFAYGLESSEQSVEQCKKNGLNVAAGFVESADYKISHNPYDAFYMLNFLEHLPEPNATLRGIYNNMTDEGIGLIEVPNFDMILKNKLFSEFIIDHLLYFTKDTLISTLLLIGYDVLDCKVEWYDYIISAVVRKKKKAEMADFYKYQNQIKDEVDIYLSRFQNKKVAIWGASHQALSIISLFNLSERIAYIIDSATFKQNKFTPATHIPIVPPDKLYSEPVDAIIVMAAGYADEVANIIRQKFDKMNISILRSFGLEIIQS